MSLSRLVHAFIRQWYFTLAGLMLTVALGAAAVHLVHPHYEAKAVVLLLPPQRASAQNPYLDLASLNGLSDVLEQALTAEMQDLGYEFTIASEQTATAGPLIRVTGDAATPQLAQKTATYVISLVPTTLRRLQSAAGVKPDAYITSIVLNPVKKTLAVRKSQTRALIVAVVGGLLLTTFVVVAAERALTVRRRRRDGAGTDDGAEHDRSHDRGRDRSGDRSRDIGDDETEDGGEGEPRSPRAEGRRKRSRRSRSSRIDTVRPTVVNGNGPKKEPATVGVGNGAQPGKARPGAGPRAS